MAVILQGCTRMLDAIVPDSGYARETSQPYGEGPRRTLDVYVPTGVKEAAAPILVFFYGGNWRDGDKATYRFLGQAFASQGIVTVVPDYRLYPETRFPGFLEDGAAAVAWARANAARLGGDPDRIYLMGHSAGAYTAAMLALDPQWLARAGVDRRAVRGLIGLAGPYDFLPLDSNTTAIFGAAPDPVATQPISFVTPDAPPMFLATAAWDSTVGPHNAANLARAARGEGVAVTAVEYPRIGHIMLVAALAAPLRWLAPVRDDAAAFIARTP
jgi:acetyl esterase/lipase